MTAKKLKGIHVSAVIVAAGSGSRMNMDINKQYIEVGGIPVLARTIQAFENCEFVKEIILVINSQDIGYCKSEIVEGHSFQKVRVLVGGGENRQQSVFNGLCAIDPTCDIVLIHDGARPFVKRQSILDSIYAACKYGAAGVAVPVKDTIKIADSEAFVRETPDRNNLWAIQTPQTFQYSLIMNAHKNAALEGFNGTDDAVLLEKQGDRLKLVMGSYDNIKITTREDLILAQAIVNNIE